MEKKCPECGAYIADEGDTTAFFCEECGFDSLDEPQAPVLECCPECHKEALWDKVDELCYACGYMTDEPVRYMESGDTYDALNSADVYQPQYFKWDDLDRDPPVYKGYDSKTWNDAEKKWSEWTYVAPEPYKPYQDLVKSLKGAWVLSTNHPINKWVSDKRRSAHGNVDITHTPKAVGPFVFMPDSMKDTKYGYTVLRHEARHAKDFWLFGGPIMFFGAFFCKPFRAFLEYRGYVETMKADYEAYGSITPGTPERIADTLASPVYGEIWKRKDLMAKWLRKAAERITGQPCPEFVAKDLFCKASEPEIANPSEILLGTGS